MHMEWTSDLEIGVAAIDNEHKLIIEFYNRIYHFYTSDVDVIMLDRAISDFKFLFSLHFLKEENFMIEIGYPDFEPHAREHETLVTLLNSAADGKGERDDTCPKIAFLVLQWLSSHLEGADRRLAAYARGQRSHWDAAGSGIAFNATC